MKVNWPKSSADYMLKQYYVLVPPDRSDSAH